MRLRNLVGGCLISAMAVAAPTASADQVFSVNTTVNGKTFSATADFTVGAGYIDLFIRNDTPLFDVVFTGQWVSQVGFSIAGYPWAGQADALSSEITGSSVYYADGAAPSYIVGADPNRAPWIYGQNPVSTFPSSGGGDWQISALKGDDKTMIAPLTTPANSVGYCTSSPANNPKCDDGIGGTFNPEYNGSATFRMLFTGLVAGADIDNVSIGFGTAPTSGGDEPDVPVVPIPAAVWLFGSGLLGLIGIARRNRSAASKA